MSEENVEIVWRVFNAAAHRDAETVFSLYASEVEWDNSRGPLRDLIGAGTYRGHEGLRRFFRDYHGQAWESVEGILEELIDAGDRVVSVVSTRARGRASGVEVEWMRHAVWTIRHGKVVRVAWFPTREEALEAAGLSQ